MLSEQHALMHEQIYSMHAPLAYALSPLPYPSSLHHPCHWQLYIRLVTFAHTPPMTLQQENAMDGVVVWPSTLANVPHVYYMYRNTYVIHV